LLGRFAPAQAVLSMDTSFSVPWSVICHTCASCLNCSIELYFIWQVHWWIPHVTM